MTQHKVGNAIEAVTHLRDARDLRTFEHAADEFLHVLGRVPNAAADEISDAQIGRLQTLAEEVIDTIEERACRSADGPAAARALISRVYEVRRLLEEVNRWERHVARLKSS